MNFGITICPNAYTPEAYAYKKFLETHGHQVQLDIANSLAPDNDLNIYFLGLKNKKNTGKAKEIHEYQSLSTPSFSRIKDLTKSIINCKPDGRIFLNSTVEKKFFFYDQVPKIHRDMGVDDAFFQAPSENPEFDIIYCGSFSGRPGLKREILRLHEIGFKLCLIGDVPSDFMRTIKNKKNIFLTGRLPREKIPEYYKKSFAGLNYTPNVYPFNIQTSTKTLEYLASGLKCISNRYSWSINFSKKTNTEFIWNEDLKNIEDLYFKKIKNSSMDAYKWSSILKNSNFLLFLENIVNENI